MSTENTQSNAVASDLPELITLYISLKSASGANSSDLKAHAVTILSTHFHSFTITEGTGFFRGEQEPVLIVHVATTLHQQVADCAAHIRAELHQEGVGIAFRGHYLRAIEGHIPQLNSSEDSHA